MKEGQNVYVLDLDSWNPQLSRAEAIACMELEEVNVARSRQEDGLLIVESRRNDSAVARAVRRSAMCKEATRLTLIEDGHVPVEDIDLSSMVDELGDVSTFCVRVSLENTPGTGGENRMLYERTLGSRLEEALPHLRVDLEMPDLTVRVIYTRTETILGVRVESHRKKGFHLRGPARRPFSHPSTLKPKLARAMVNLSRTGKDEFLLDPFCGSGTILIEAAYLGAIPVGCDISEKACEGAKSNLNWFETESLGVVRCDSTHLPIRKCHSVVTDPPYGRLSSRAGKKGIDIYRSLIRTCEDVLMEGGRLVFMHPASKPAWMEDPTLLEQEDLFDIPVHGSLTRRLRVLRKPGD